MSDNKIFALTMPKWGLTMEEGTIGSWLIDEGDEVGVGAEILEVETDKIAQPVESTVAGVLRRQIGEEGEEYPVQALIGIIADASVSDAEIDAFVASYGGGAGAEDDEDEDAGSDAAPAVEGIFELTMPKWGLTMEEGTIGSWLVDEGDEIDVGDEIVEIETDKIAQAVESTVAGVLRRQIGEEGEDYPVKALIGIIADADVSDARIDQYLAGRGGAAVEEDEEEEAQAAASAAAASTSKAITPMRAAIANTVTNSWAMPQFPVTMAIDMSAAKKLRAGFKEAGKAVSLNDLVIKACAKAMETYPMVNATLGKKEYQLNPEVNIAVAVGMDEALMMPVVKGCQALSLEDLAAATRAMIDKVQAGKAGPADMAGGNFAISNMGMFGIEQFSALVPPGMAGILAVGGIKDEPVVKDGNIVAAAMMRVTLVVDHRVVDGAYAAQYLVELKRLLENPEQL